MTLVLLIITLAYLALIGSFVIGFDKLKPFYLDELEVKTKFSIIIPFKNEAENLEDLLTSLKEIKYPENLFEVILVNDASDDDSVKIIQKVLDTKFSKENSTRTDIKIINNNRKTISPKKDAINNAISIAKFDWILMTDADCIVPKYWLESFDAFIRRTDTSLITGPVSYQKAATFLDRFQTLDLLSLIGATIGGFGIGKPFMCNGANLGYKKSLFKELNGYEGNTNIASGDDIFLLEKAIKIYPKQVHYLKSELAVVKTKPQSSLNDLVNQRIRWAAKTSNYSNLFGIITGLLVLLMNATVICGLLFVLIGLIHYKLFLYIIVIKFSIDFLLIYKSARFFNQEELLSSYIFSCFIYPFFSVFVALTSVFRGFKWKGIYYNK